MESGRPVKRGMTVFKEFEGISARDGVSVLKEQGGRKVK